MEKKVPLVYDSESQTLKRVQGSFDPDLACTSHSPSHSLGNNTRSQFFARASHSGASTRRASTSHFFPSGAVLLLAAVRPAERIPTLDPFPPCHPLQPRMACCNRHVKCATYACDPISSAARAVCVCARVSKSAFPSHIHHTSSPDGKQAALPCLDFELLPVPTNYAAWADRVAIPVGVLS